MFFKKPINFNLTVFMKVVVIMVLDVLATGTSYFLGLWFRYDFSFQAMREVHFESFLNAIGPWCLITIAVFLVFRLYSSIWAFVSTSEVFRIIGAYVVLAVIGPMIFPFDGNFMPRMSMIVGYIFSFLFTVGIRFSYRLYRRLCGKSARQPTLPVFRMSCSSVPVMPAVPWQWNLPIPTMYGIILPASLMTIL